MELAESIIKYLIETGVLNLPVIILSLVIYFGYKYFVRLVHYKDGQIREKDKIIIAISERSIKLATLWKEKTDGTNDAVEEVKEMISKIRDALIANKIMKP